MTDEHGQEPADGSQPDRSEPGADGPSQEHGGQEESDSTELTYGLIFGMMIGVVLFSVTDNPLWIAVGMPLGLAVGVAYDNWS